MKTQPIFDWNTNFVYISDKLKEFFPEFHDCLIEKFSELDIKFGVLRGTKDIWCRDYMPIQITDDEVVGFKYDPDYLKEPVSAYDKRESLTHLKSCDVCTEQYEVWKRNNIPLNLCESSIVLDGGNVVICGNYILLTDKVFKENPHETKDSLLKKIEELFGLTPVIIPWVPTDEDVFGHTDGMVKALPYTDGKPAILTAPIFKKDSQLLHRVLDDKFDVKEIKFDVRGRGIETYGWAYINFLQVGNKILVPSFGLPCEPSVMQQIQSYYPDCIVDSIEMREIADCGGALHCITWNIKK